MRKGVKLVALMLLFVCLSSPAQNMSKREIRKKTIKAENYFDKGEFLKSLQIWEQLLRQDSMSAYYNYHAGVCKFNLVRFRLASVKNFMRSYNKISHDVHYYLGRVYHITSQLNEALKEYEIYLDAKGQKSFTEKEVRHEISKVLEAQRKMNAPTRSELFNLGPEINTQYAEYVPLISADGKTLFFTSRRPGSSNNETDAFGDYYEDVYQSQLSSAKWSAAQNMSVPVNTNRHDACVSLTPEGQTLLIYRSGKSQSDGDIYSSTFNGSTWSEPALVNGLNSEKYQEPSACYSPDGLSIIFSSNRPEGFGGKDLYRINLLPNGKWSEAVNLGPSVNTAYDEDAPFIHPDGKRLFFSSTGHENMGGYDVFYSNADTLGKWGKPVNMGYPLNTVDDDIYFVMTGDGNTGYISSDRLGGSGMTDIYKVLLHENDVEYEVMTGFVKDESNKALDAKITLIDNSSNKIAGIFKTNRLTGKFILLVSAEKDYTLLVESADHRTFSEHIHFGKDDIQVTLKNK